MENQENNEEEARVGEIEESRFADIEEVFKRHSEYAKNAKKEYDAIYERLLEKLSASHIEPLAKILLERENIVLDSESSIASMQERIRKVLLEPWHMAWEEHIAGNLTKLEVLKETFKKYEGIDWEVNRKTVDDRIQPMRIEFKHKRQQWLQKQLPNQKRRIEELTAKIMENRLLAQQAMDETVKLDERLNNIDVETKKEHLKKAFNDLLFRPDEASPDEKGTSA